MLTFIDAWVLSPAGHGDHFFSARGIAARPLCGGSGRLPFSDLVHRPYTSTSDYFYAVRRRYDELVRSFHGVDILAPIPGMPVRLVDAILEAHNYCIHHLALLRACPERGEPTLFRHSDACFQEPRS
ncbi:MAG: hypothetical protein HC888_15905 [Candidatus Competibacteraceae bacterium]|nr:hypothetical protein [Candidatus Competibacteraceae bacterium]